MSMRIQYQTGLSLVPGVLITPSNAGGSIVHNDVDVVPGLPLHSIRDLPHLSELL